MNSLYAIDTNKYEKWKGRPYYLCKTPGMALFMALYLLPYHKKHGWLSKPRKIPKFPGEISDCQCRDCRYQRWLNAKPD